MNLIVYQVLYAKPINVKGTVVATDAINLVVSQVPKAKQINV